MTGEIVYAGAGVDYENFSSLFVVEASIGGGCWVSGGKD